VSDHQASPTTVSQQEADSSLALESLAEIRPGAGGFVSEMIVRTAILTGSVGGLFLLAAPVAYWLHGDRGLSVAALSAGVCVAGSMVSIFACLQFRSPGKMLYQVLAGMLTRMMAPLALAAAMYVSGGWVREAGGVGFLLFFYLATLAVETRLVLRDVHNAVPYRTREELAAMPELPVEPLPDPLAKSSGLGVTT